MVDALLLHIEFCIKNIIQLPHLSKNQLILTQYNTKHENLILALFTSIRDVMVILSVFFTCIKYMYIYSFM